MKQPNKFFWASRAAFGALDRLGWYIHFPWYELSSKGRQRAFWVLSGDARVHIAKGFRKKDPRSLKLLLYSVKHKAKVWQ
jgi:hypothetical protein